MTLVLQAIRILKTDGLLVEFSQLRGWITNVGITNVSIVDSKENLFKYELIIRSIFWWF